DQDPKQLAVAQERLGEYGARCQLVQARFSHLAKVARTHGVTAVDGILFDLGFSSRQLADETYGLTFADNAPLDMRLSPALPQSAADWLNHANEVEIGDTLYLYGDRHNSRALARKI